MHMQAQRHRGAFRGRTPQITACAPQTMIVPPQERTVPPKKFTGLVLLECSSRPETPKILVVTPEFVNKNGFSVDFAIKTFCFCGFTPKFMKIRTFVEMKTIFFYVFISDFVEIRAIYKMNSRICGISRLF